MNYSDLQPLIYTYLGYKGVQPDGEIDRLISACLEELEKIQGFGYRYKILSDIPAFLQKEPYLSFLNGCSAVILCVCTLGAETDRKIKYLERADMQKSLIFDACASAYLEWRADDFERGLGDNLTYRFCPGYGGSDLSDIRYIFDLVKPEKIGVTLLNSNLMLPQKSMAGIIGAGKAAKKTCAGCVNFSACEYRKEGTTCYGSVKK